MWGICEACFLLALVLILSDWRALKWRPSTLILEENHTPSGMTNSLPPHKFFLPSSLSFFHYSIYLCVLMFLFSSIANSVSIMLLCFLPCSFNFRPSSSITIYLYFFLYPLEVNLYTYLTTWLRVRVQWRSSLGYHHIINKISILSKVSCIKWINKSTHITNASPIFMIAWNMIFRESMVVFINELLSYAWGIWFTYEDNVG